MKKIIIVTHGGKGSGNFGHKGGKGGKGNPGGSSKEGQKKTLEELFGLGDAEANRLVKEANDNRSPHTQREIYLDGKTKPPPEGWKTSGLIETGNTIRDKDGNLVLAVTPVYVIDENADEIFDNPMSGHALIAVAVKGKYKGEVIGTYANENSHSYMIHRVHDDAKIDDWARFYMKRDGNKKEAHVSALYAGVPIGIDDRQGDTAKAVDNIYYAASVLVQKGIKQDTHLWITLPSGMGQGIDTTFKNSNPSSVLIVHFIYSNDSLAIFTHPKDE